MNSYNTAGDQTLPFHDDEVYIFGVSEVARASETDQQSPNQPPPPPVDVFTTTVINVLGWSVVETLTKSGTLSYMGIEKIYLKGVGGVRRWCQW